MFSSHLEERSPYADDISVSALFISGNSGREPVDRRATSSRDEEKTTFAEDEQAVFIPVRHGNVPRRFVLATINRRPATTSLTAQQPRI